MRKYVRFFVCCFVLMLGLLPFACATTEIVGMTSPSAGSFNLSGNYLSGINVTDTVPAGTWYVNQICVYAHNHTTAAGVDGYAKAVLLNESGEVREVSSAQLVDVDSATLFTFNMSGNCTIGDNYVIAIITNTGHRIDLSTAVGSSWYYYDDNNLFSAPVDVTEAHQGGASVPTIYAVLTDVENWGATPVPTVTPSASAGSGGLSNSALNALLGQFFWWLAVLIIVLGPAFVFGVLFKGGTWGFLVGLLAGAGLGYWLMPTLVPLWLVVGVVFAVAAMAWSVMGRSS